MFNKLYSHYKHDWDAETRMKNANVTYADLMKKLNKADDWF